MMPMWLLGNAICAVLMFFISYKWPAFRPVLAFNLGAILVMAFKQVVLR